MIGWSHISVFSECHGLTVPLTALHMFTVNSETKQDKIVDGHQVDVQKNASGMVGLVVRMGSGAKQDCDCLR